MILLADAGSTKTEWAVLENTTMIDRWESPGLNPLTMSGSAISSTLHEALHIVRMRYAWKSIFFYGAGCRDQGQLIMKDLISQIIPSVEIHIHSDLLGACRAVENGLPSLVSIMGTGSSCCISDGNQILDQSASLGYILGDEGGGADIGRKFVKLFYSGKVDPDISNAFMSSTGMDQQNWIPQFYKSEDKANRLGMIARFVLQNIDRSLCRKIIVQSLDDFFNFYANPLLDRQRIEGLYFIGGVAFQIREILDDYCRERKLPVPQILRRPLEGIVRYHILHSLTN